MNIKKELNELIKQNLPEATAGALKERLEELEGKEKQLKRVLKDKESLERTIEEKDLEIEEFKRLKNKAISLTEWELQLNQAKDDLDRREIGLNHQQTILDLTLKFADTRVQDHKDMFSTVFRNTTLRNSTLKNVVKKSDFPEFHYNSSGNDTLIEKEEIVPVIDDETITEE